jgi:hypothetical protein
LPPLKGRRPDVTQLQELMAVPDAASRLQAEAKPSALRRGWEVGDLLVYQEKDQVGWFKRERTLRHRVLVLTDGQILTRSYDLFDQQFNRMRTDDWQWATPASLLVGDYTLGKTWTTEFRRLYRRFGGSVEVQAQGKVVARDLTPCASGGLRNLSGRIERQLQRQRQRRAVRGNVLGRCCLGQTRSLRAQGLAG